MDLLYKRDGRNPAELESALGADMTRFSVRNVSNTLLQAVLFILALAVGATPGCTAAEEGPAFKFTLGSYRYSDDSQGVDANLRHTSGLGNVWLGYFRLPDQDVSQWRGGWDRTFGEDVRFSPSLQLASGGFEGGSVALEAGAPWFASVGLGRTNLKPYYNLNFDPNDSYSLSAGRRDESGQLFAVQYVRDNRENPSQRHLHFVYRQPFDGGNRLTVDVLYKKGLVEDELIKRWGFTLAYDWPRFFVRLARDPKTNFTPVDAWRFSVGTRF